ncbi:MAG: hypothetical protein PF692_03170 [Kiritimatiellae bacterium]|jgi:hypothetical protein|nr:hypothetical protein [Kiritimatiellia bacterium]
MANDSIFNIGADVQNINAEEIVAQIREKVEQNMDDGIYQDPTIAAAEKHRLINVKGIEDFTPYFMSCLKASISIDINDFEIVEKRSKFGKILVKYKTLIWKSLKFYTYRLWSQQNYVNSLLLSALETVEQNHRIKLESLEKRIEELEKKLEEK